MVTKEEVINELLRLQNEGHSMRQSDFENWLIHGIRKYFGGYKNAKEELNISPKYNYDKLRELKTKYTDSDIKETLIMCHEKGYTSKDVYEKYPSICKTACRRWGGLQKACDYFGIPRFKIKNTKKRPLKWDKERIVKTLTELDLKGVPLSSNYLRKNGHEHLVSAVKRNYGTWNNGLKALGFEIYYETPNLEWTKESLKEAALSEIKNGCEPTFEALSSRIRGFGQAIRNYFGNYTSFKEYAGYRVIKTDKPTVEKEVDNSYRPNLTTKEGFKREIIRLYYIGAPLNYHSIKKLRRRLLNAAKELFGSWQNALEYSGFNYDDIKISDNTASECGEEFERILGEILRDLGVSYKKYAHDRYSPDFVLDNNEWIDAKLSEWTDVSETVKRYLPECSSLTIVYLQGKKSDVIRGRKHKYRAVSVYLLTEKLPKEKRDYYNEKLTDIENRINESSQTA
jgi:hypothetical protein